MMGGPRNLRHPVDGRLGVDVAGHVEAVGRNVTHLKPGDAVFGICKGAFAEYACASLVAIKPAEVTFDQAASAPVAAITALPGLRDHGRIQPGHKVLISGAAGGVGTFAVQIARAFGAEVTGVCRTTNVELLRSLGADRVIDYTREDFTNSAQRYDLFLDCVDDHSFSACRRILNPQAIHVVLGAPFGLWIGPLGRLFKAVLLSRVRKQNVVPFIAKPTQKDLAIIGDLIAAGKVKPVIENRFRLTEVPEAIRCLETGHPRGKIVITLE
jgi:NADPH:quinone reductase-like Zn-dependent oxidoreductase